MHFMINGVKFPKAAAVVLGMQYACILHKSCLIIVPSWAALAMSTMFVTFGVSLAKNGILTACRTHRQMFLTSSGA